MSNQSVWSLATMELLECSVVRNDFELFTKKVVLEVFSGRDYNQKISLCCRVTTLLFYRLVSVGRESQETILNLSKDGADGKLNGVSVKDWYSFHGKKGQDK